ncbi:VWA domain-containing protein [Rhodobacteraceae bacterium NNCM2]|nr:VWA domain-containing protein [Coraliihabitans acroporae]
MTDHDDLKKTLAASPPPVPDTATRQRAMHEALSAFDAAGAKENSAASQGNVSPIRRNVRQSGLKTFWRRLMSFNLSSTRTLMMGGASAAVLTVAVMAHLNMRGGETMKFRPVGSPSTEASKAELNDAAHPAEMREEADAVLPAPQPDAGLEIAAQAPSPERAAKATAPASAMTGAAPLGLAGSSDLAGSRQVEAKRRMLPIDGEAAADRYREQGRDKFADIDPNDVKVTAEEPVSTFSIDVDTASYSFVRASLMNGVLPQKDAVRVEELVNYFPYDYAGPDSRETPFASSVTVMPTPWNAETKLMRIGIKGYDLAPAEKPRSNLVFLLDTSGSMNAPEKLPLLKNSFRMLVDSLDADDTVSIVVYAGSAGTVLEPTKVADKAKILASLDQLSAGGSTAGGEGIRQAYRLAEANFDKEGVNRVILATDGDFNVGITDIDELKGFVERKRDSGVYLSVLGFGRGNYNDALMQTLAQNGNGQAAYIDTLNEARKTLVEGATSTLFPIAKDVKIQVEFNPAMVAEYRLIGYETRLLDREDFNNDKIDAGEIGSGHAVTALYEITPTGSAGRKIDDLRYQATTAEAPESDEYAFVKIRYKQPDQNVSELISRPVTIADETAPDTEARFAAAVAAFGQILRGGRHTGAYTYDDVIELANGAKGEDLFGYRAEFVNLVRMAKTAAAMEPQQQ